MKLDTYLPMIEQKLEELLPKEHCRYERLIEAMRYSLWTAASACGQRSFWSSAGCAAGTCRRRCRLPAQWR